MSLPSSFTLCPPKIQSAFSSFSTNGGKKPSVLKRSLQLFNQQDNHRSGSSKATGQQGSLVIRETTFPSWREQTKNPPALRSYSPFETLVSERKMDQGPISPLNQEEYQAWKDEKGHGAEHHGKQQGKSGETTSSVISLRDQHSEAAGDIGAPAHHRLAEQEARNRVRILLGKKQSHGATTTFKAPCPIRATPFEPLVSQRNLNGGTLNPFSRDIRSIISPSSDNKPEEDNWKRRYHQAELARCDARKQLLGCMEENRQLKIQVIGQKAERLTSTKRPLGLSSSSPRKRLRKERQQLQEEIQSDKKSRLQMERPSDEPQPRGVISYEDEIIKFATETAPQQEETTPVQMESLVLVEAKAPPFQEKEALLVKEEAVQEEASPVQEEFAAPKVAGRIDQSISHEATIVPPEEHCEKQRNLVDENVEVEVAKETEVSGETNTSTSDGAMIGRSKEHSVKHNLGAAQSGGMQCDIDANKNTSDEAMIDASEENSEEQKLDDTQRGGIQFDGVKAVAEENELSEGTNFAEEVSQDPGGRSFETQSDTDNAMKEDHEQSEGNKDLIEESAHNGMSIEIDDSVSNDELVALPDASKTELTPEEVKANLKVQDALEQGGNSPMVVEKKTIMGESVDTDVDNKAVAMAQSRASGDSLADTSRTEQTPEEMSAKVQDASEECGYSAMFEEKEVNVMDETIETEAHERVESAFNKSLSLELEKEKSVAMERSADIPTRDPSPVAAEQQSKTDAVISTSLSVETEDQDAGIIPDFDQKAAGVEQSELHVGSPAVETYRDNTADVVVDTEEQLHSSSETRHVNQKRSFINVQRGSARNQASAFYDTSEESGLRLFDCDEAEDQSSDTQKEESKEDSILFDYSHSTAHLDSSDTTNISAPKQRRRSFTGEAEMGVQPPPQLEAADGGNNEETTTSREATYCDDSTLLEAEAEIGVQSPPHLQDAAGGNNEEIMTPREATSSDDTTLLEAEDFNFTPSPLPEACPASHSSKSVGRSVEVFVEEGNSLAELDVSAILASSHSPAKSSCAPKPTNGQGEHSNSDEQAPSPMETSSVRECPSNTKVLPHALDSSTHYDDCGPGEVASATEVAGVLAGTAADAPGKASESIKVAMEDDLFTVDQNTHVDDTDTNNETGKSHPSICELRQNRTPKLHCKDGESVGVEAQKIESVTHTEAHARSGNQESTPLNDEPEMTGGQSSGPMKHNDTVSIADEHLPSKASFVSERKTRSRTRKKRVRKADSSTEKAAHSFDIAASAKLSERERPPRQESQTEDRNGQSRIELADTSHDEGKVNNVAPSETNVVGKDSASSAPRQSLLVSVDIGSILHEGSDGRPPRRALKNVARQILQESMIQEEEAQTAADPEDDMKPRTRTRYQKQKETKTDNTASSSGTSARKTEDDMKPRTRTRSQKQKETKIDDTKSSSASSTRKTRSSQKKSEPLKEDGVEDGDPLASSTASNVGAKKRGTRRRRGTIVTNLQAPVLKKRKAKR